MNAKELPSRPSLEQYRKQAKDLVKSYAARRPEAIQRIRQFHPRWSRLSESEVQRAKVSLADAQWVIAREHGFESWPKFAQQIEALTRERSPETIWRMAETAIVTGDVPTLEGLLREHETLFRDGRPPEYGPGGLRPDYSGGDARSILLREHHFETWPDFTRYLEERAGGASPVAWYERAADAIVAGDAPTLERLLRDHSELVQARSSRKHRAPLLHYLGGINGGESYRQKCPKNAVEIARILLRAGAPVDVLAGPYGNCTALGSVATGIQPFLAGVADALIETLLEHGADVNANPWSIVNACLANGRPWSAELLAARGARLDLEGCAGVGRLDLVRAFFQADGSLKPGATPAQMKDGFTWACEFGRTPVVEFLLDRGMVIDAPLRHHGQTALHWAAGGGHLETVKLLLARNAPVDAQDEHWKASPLSWALFGWQNPLPGAAGGRYHEAVSLLVASGANVKPEWLADETVRADPIMLAALSKTALS